MTPAWTRASTSKSSSLPVARRALEIAAWSFARRREDRHLFVFAFVEAGRQGSGLVRRTAVRASVVAEVGGGVVGRSEQLSLPERRGALEHAQQNASPKTTKLYDRTAATVTVDEIERIVI